MGCCWTKRNFRGVQFQGPSNSVRRIAHKISDLIYLVLLEKVMFDTRIAFISEKGQKIIEQKD